MKPKTDDKGVRRAVFSAADVTLWRRMLNSLVEIQIIELHDMHSSRVTVYQMAAKAQGDLEAILQKRVLNIEPPTDTATDEGADKETP